MGNFSWLMITVLSGAARLTLAQDASDSSPPSEEAKEFGDRRAEEVYQKELRPSPDAEPRAAGVNVKGVDRDNRYYRIDGMDGKQLSSQGNVVMRSELGLLRDALKKANDELQVVYNDMVLPANMKVFQDSERAFQLEVDRFDRLNRGQKPYFRSAIKTAEGEAKNVTIDEVRGYRDYYHNELQKAQERYKAYGGKIDEVRHQLEVARNAANNDLDGKLDELQKVKEKDPNYLQARQEGTQAYDNLQKKMLKLGIQAKISDAMMNTNDLEKKVLTDQVKLDALEKVYDDRMIGNYVQMKLQTVLDSDQFCSIAKACPSTVKPNTGRTNLDDVFGHTPAKKD